MPLRSLLRRDPFNDIFDFRRGIDDVFNRFLSTPMWERAPGVGANVDWIPAVESYIDQNKYHVRMALPGVKAGDVNIQVRGNELYISGERKQELTPAEERSFQREILYGSFERVLPLPEGVQGEKLDAKYENGVLEVSAPLSEKAIPRRVEIKGLEPGKKLAA